MKDTAIIRLAAALGPSFYRNTVMNHSLAPMSPNGERWIKMQERAERIIKHLNDRGWSIVPTDQVKGRYKPPNTA